MKDTGDQSLDLISQELQEFTRRKRTFDFPSSFKGDILGCSFIKFRGSRCAEPLGLHDKTHYVNGNCGIYDIDKL